MKFDAKESIAHVVRGRRKELGLSRERLAGLAGVSSGLIKLLELGNLKSPPKLENLLNLERALKLHPDTLVDLAKAARNAPLPEGNKRGDREEDLMIPDPLGLAELPKDQQETVLEALKILRQLPPADLEREVDYLRGHIRRLEAASEKPRAKGRQSEA